MSISAISVPQAVEKQRQIKSGDISFVHYHDRGSLFKNRVVFNQYAISFVLNGQKEIYRLAERTVIKAGEGMLIPAGHTIIAEHSLNADDYSSLIIFFPGDLIDQFLEKQQIVLPAERQQATAASFIHFSNNDYLDSYLDGVRLMIANGRQLSQALALHKLQELLLVMYEIYPTQFLSLVSANTGVTQLSLKSLVENNLFNNLTLEELAFLANRSVSSFKRDFEKAYNISPQKYIREHKLEAACAELKKGKQASELYDSYGYDNLSNFNTAFKKKFGITPAAYRQQLAI